MKILVCLFFTLYSTKNKKCLKSSSKSTSAFNPHQLQDMESLASSQEFLYGNYDLVLDEDNEIAPEGIQQI